jgi:hypothetical protein
MNLLPRPDRLWDPTNLRSNGFQGLFPWGKAAGPRSSPPPSAKVKNVWSYTSTPQYAFMSWWLVKNNTETTLLYLP